MIFTPEGIAVIIGALALAIIQIMNNIRQGRTETKVDKVVTGIEGVHTLVNNTSSEAKKENNALQARIDALNLLVANKDKDAALATQQALSRAAEVRIIPQAEDTKGTEESLTNIDKNTENIEKNTARTEKVVKGLKK